MTQKKKKNYNKKFKLDCLGVTLSVTVLVSFTAMWLARLHKPATWHWYLLALGIGVSLAASIYFIMSLIPHYSSQNNRKNVDK